MTPRGTRPRDIPERPTNPHTLALRVQEGRCPNCRSWFSRGTEVEITRPEFHSKHIVRIVRCYVCRSEWTEKYVLSEVEFVSLPEKP